MMTEETSSTSLLNQGANNTRIGNCFSEGDVQGKPSELDAESFPLDTSVADETSNGPWLLTQPGSPEQDSNMTTDTDRMNEAQHSQENKNEMGRSGLSSDALDKLQNDSWSGLPLDKQIGLDNATSLQTGGNGANEKNEPVHVNATCSDTQPQPSSCQQIRQDGIGMIDGSDHEEEDSSDEEESSDDDDEDHNDEESGDYMMAVEKNKRRNKALLLQLGFAPLNDDSGAAPHGAKRSAKPVKKPPKRRRMGFCMSNKEFQPKQQPAFEPFPRTFSEFLHHYPHREKQIKMLYSCIHATVQQTKSYPEEVYVPPSIIVTGASGTGKTSVVRDVIRFYGTKRSTEMNVAHVQCSSISSITGILYAAFKQLIKAKGARIELKMDVPTQRPGTLLATSCAIDDVEDKRRSSVLAIDSVDNNNETTLRENLEDMDEDEMERQKKLTLRRRKSLHREAREKQTVDGESHNHRVVSLKSQIGQGQETHLTVHNFGLALEPYFGIRAKKKRTKEGSSSKTAFLILDDADFIFDLPGPGKRNKFLSQLLLLPRTLGLSMTVICITRSVLLEYTRLNNTLPRERATGTLGDAMVPVKIHFDSYSSSMCEELLSIPRIRRSITGDTAEGPAEESSSRVLTSFLSLWTQSCTPLTTDLAEVIRLARMLWPIYILPIKQQHASLQQPGKGEDEEALDGATNTRPEISSATLNHRILPTIRHVISHNLFRPCRGLPVTCAGAVPSTQVAPEEGTGTTLPYLAKCLYLAAFLCQQNRADHDARLFTIQKSGKRSKRGRKSNDRADDELEANFHGSKELAQQRKQSFSRERLTSVFLNIVGLNARGVGEKGNDTDNVSIPATKMGTLSFYRMLMQMRDSGFLVERNSQRYHCILTQAQAEDVAASIDFELSKFLMRGPAPRCR